MQKPESNLKSTGLIACAVLALSSIGFTGAAFAASDSAAATATPSTASSSELSERSGHKKMHRRGHDKRGHHRLGKAALVVPGYGPLPQDVVDALDLNTEQAALLSDAKSFIQDQRKAHRERRNTDGPKQGRTIDTPLDPHAALKRQDERFNAMQALRTESTQKWLAVWDSLDQSQQQTISDYVVKRGQERAQRAAEHRQKRQARHADKS